MSKADIYFIRQINLRAQLEQSIILINCSYWTPQLEVLSKNEHGQSKNFQMYMFELIEV